VNLNKAKYDQPKLLILILAIDKEPWKSIEIMGQEATWDNDLPINVQAVRYVARLKFGIRPLMLRINWVILNSRFGIRKIAFFHRVSKKYIAKLNRAIISRMPDAASVDHGIAVAIPEEYSLIGLKTLSAFNFALNNFDFDFLFRINVSSYLDVNSLQLFLSELEPINVFAGVHGNHFGQDFASGSGYLLSKDVVQMTVDNYRDWDHSLIDDVALGKLLTKTLKLNMTSYSRTDFQQPEQVSKISSEDFSKNFLYRCKTDSSSKTIAIMKSIHARLQADRHP
jgi:hypothetical protein